MQRAIDEVGEVGHLVGDLPGPGGHPVPYQTFVAPGLLAAAAMNGAIFDTTFNFFVKFKYAHTYDAMLATPLRVDEVAAGEVVWALLRGTIYAAGFLVTMGALGLVESGWAVLALPAAVLIGLGFAGAGLAAGPGAVNAGAGASSAVAGEGPPGPGPG